MIAFSFYKTNFTIFFSAQAKLYLCHPTWAELGRLKSQNKQLLSQIGNWLWQLAQTDRLGGQTLDQFTLSHKKLAFNLTYDTYEVTINEVIRIADQGMRVLFMSHDIVLCDIINSVQRQNISVQQPVHVVPIMHIEHVKQYVKCIIPKQDSITFTEIPAAVDFIAVLDASVAINVNFFIGYSNAKESGMLLFL